MASYNRSYFVDVVLLTYFLIGRLNRFQSVLRIFKQAKQNVKELKKSFNNSKYKSTKLDHEKPINCEVEKSYRNAHDNESIETVSNPVDYENYEPVVGAPNVNDKIAFQVN
jgi:hypothetical protein